ncbi:MAG: noncanonical pyrimidine nucleotidase, YjjG family [Chlamydiia bacterium]|nr:noncanonical pyrimidine nucleotidase, YjjG family [Chlamydiia bacterium]
MEFDSFRGILFDLDDTLIDFKQSEQISLHNCYRAFFAEKVGFEAFEKQYTQINRALWKAVEEGKCSTTHVGQERFRQLADLFGVPFHSKVPLYYEQQLVQHATWISGAEAFLQKIQRQKIKIGYLTNGFSHVQQSKFRNLGLDRFSNILVISEEVGVPKPHPAIFHHALQLLGTKAEETLMVGDSLVSDGQGARSVGMKFCWYNPSRIPPPDWTPDLILTQLSS